MVWPAFPHCLEGYFRKTGSEQNTVRDSGIRWRDTECDCQTRSKISWNLATDASLEKNDTGNSDEKSLGCAFKTLLSRPYNLLLFFLSCALPFAIYCTGQFSVQNLCQTALELQSELSDCSCILSWSHSTIWHDILVLTNLQGFTKNKISHQHKQATFLLLRVKTAVFDLAVHFQSQRTGFENAPTKRRRSTSISQLPILDPLLKLALRRYTIYSISLRPLHS